MTNPNFGGGLIISGKNLQTGENFTQGLTTTMSMRLSLDAGKWVFTAIGWDGGSSLLPFGGNPYCSKVFKDLSGSSATVAMDMTKANCGIADFAGTLPDNTGAFPTIRKLDIVSTCNTFLNGVPTEDGSQQILSMVINGASSPSFCDQLPLPSDLRSKVRSIRIHALNKLPGRLLHDIAFMSPCIESESTYPSMIEVHSSSGPTNPYNVNELRLPLKGAPLMITTFQEGNCTDPVAKYIFENGLEPKDPNFDHILVDNAGDPDSVKLYLPSNDLRRAISPFAHLLPFFKDGSGAKFLTQPPTVPQPYHAQVGEEKRVRVERNNCNFMPITTSTNSSSETCTVLGNEIELAFTPTTLGPGSITLNTTPVETINFYAEASAAMTRYDANKLIWNLLGPEDPNTAHKDFFYDSASDEESDYGVLSRVRSMLTSNGAGGVIGVSTTDPTKTFFQYCTEVQDEKSVSIFNNEKMVFETYKVKVHNNVSGGPDDFTCSDTSYNSSCSGQTFDKRMLIWDYQMDLIHPSIVLEFNCDNFVGEYESRYTHLDGSNKIEVNTRMRWRTNTTSTNQYQRFIFAENVKITDQNDVLLNDQRTMSRVQKVDSNNYAVWNFNFASSKNGANYEELIDKTEVSKKSATQDICHYRANQVFTGDYGSIFTTSTSSVATLRGEVPNSFAPANQFTINDAFPQAMTTAASCPNMPSYGDSKIDGILMKLSSMNSDYAGLFGTNFFTNP